MTTELEQEFYDTFGIEPKIDYDYKTIIQNVTKARYWFDKEYLIEMFNNNQKFKVIQVRKNTSYPKITAEKLLEMICINSYFCGVNFHNLWVKNPDELKAVILDEIIRWYKEQKYGHEKCKHQIQQLFKGEE